MLPWLIAVLVLATRLPLLSHTQAEVDEYQFSAALDDFDVLADRPHPPGYPVFVVLGRLARLVVPDPFRALTVLSAVACAVATLTLARLARRYVGERAAWFAALLFAANPTCWITSLRALSEMPGLVATTLAVLLLLEGTDGAGPWRAILGAVLGAAAVGIRSASCFVVLPVLALATLRLLLRRELVGVAAMLAAFALGNGIWIGGLILDTGSLTRLLAAIHGQSAHIYQYDNIVAAAPSISALARALRNIWIEPWGFRPLGWALSAVAGVGWLSLLARRPRSALELLCVFVPFVVIDALYLSTPRLRYQLYALPLLAISASALPGAIRGSGGGRGPRVASLVAEIALVGSAFVAGSWALPRTINLHRQAVPFERAVAWLRPKVDRTVVIGRDADFLLPLHYLVPEWRTRDLADGLAPVPGFKILALTAFPDITGNPVQQWDLEAGLARMLTIDPTAVYVFEPRVFLGAGFFTAERSGESIWRWMTDRAELVVLGSDREALDLVLDVAAPPRADPTRRSAIAIAACGESLGSFPLELDRKTLRVGIPPTCAHQPEIPIRLGSLEAFVPAEENPASNDRRRLAVQVFRIEATATAE